MLSASYRVGVVPQMVLWKGESDVGNHFVEVDPHLPIGRVLDQAPNSLFVVEHDRWKHKGIDDRSRVVVEGVLHVTVSCSLPIDPSQAT